MNNMPCSSDFSQMHSNMTKKLAKVSQILEHNIRTLEQNNIEMLNDIETITKELFDLESEASTYFMNCLLTEYTEESAEISRTVHKLRLKRHGALIVIEKNIPAAPLVSGGIPINARVSSQLLESIFNPKSQLHHGAVIIKGNIVLSAANQLPVTEQIFWDRMFDPREMSAVGLSERSDALLLLVSENGSTSFSIHGNLYPFSSR